MPLGIWKPLAELIGNQLNLLGDATNPSRKWRDKTNREMGLAMYYMYWWKSLKAACNWFAPICAQIGCLDGFVSVISETPAPRLTSMNHRQ